MECNSNVNVEISLLCVAYDNLLFLNKWQFPNYSFTTGKYLCSLALIGLFMEGKNNSWTLLERLLNAYPRG